MILLVDDEIFSLEMMGRKLKGKGFKVLQATSVAKAKELFEQTEGIVAVITDLHMPDGDGMELLKWVQALQPETKRIILSAHTYEQVLVDELSGGLVHKAFTKPIDVDLELAPALLEILALS